MTTTIPSIPEVPLNIEDPVLRQFLIAIKEVSEIRFGERGEFGDRAITYNDLLQADVLKLRAEALGSAKNLNDIEATTAILDTIPPKLANLIVTGVFAAINITWDAPVFDLFSHVEIFRAVTTTGDPEPVFGVATQVGSTTSAVFHDVIGDGANNKTYYYWVKVISTFAIEGPISDISTGVVVSEDPAYVLQVLAEEITTSQLAAALENRIDLIDNTGVVTTTVDQRITDSSALLTTSITSNSTALTTQQGITDGLSASFTVKTSVNGHVAGFGLASEVNEAGITTSDFIIVADRFAIIDPADTLDSDAVVPFIVSGGNVIINTAIIGDATITSAMIGSVSADNITTGTITATIGLVSANITGGTITIGGADPNTAPFHVSTTGQVSIRSASTGARLVIQNNRIQVYDSAGLLRVEIGDLTG